MRPLLLLLMLVSAVAGAVPAEPPPTLEATGWRRAGVLPYAPLYGLWSDGAEKQRWIWLPPGQAIDAREPDAWVFPPGTKLWKQFSHDGRPVETRYVERRADGSWFFAAYVWNEAGTAATLAPAAGAKLPVPGAPNGRYVVPSRSDCLACHGSAAVPVLAFGALQLSDDRDPLAVHGRAADARTPTLRQLVARGWLRGLPQALLDTPPRIAAAAPVERAALGYLHANCAHCHNASAQRVPVALTLAQQAVDAPGSRERTLQSLQQPSRYQPAPPDAWPAARVLALRMQSRHAAVQMPPLGTERIDADGLALVLQWLNHDLIPTSKESPP